jgi:hypothetical protein
MSDPVEPIEEREHVVGEETFHSYVDANGRMCGINCTDAQLGAVKAWWHPGGLPADLVLDGAIAGCRAEYDRLVELGLIT